MDRLKIIDVIEDALRLADAVAEHYQFDGNVCDLDEVLCNHWVCQESGCLEWKRERFLDALGQLRREGTALAAPVVPGLIRSTP